VRLDRVPRALRLIGAVPLLRHINQMLVSWVMRKFKRFKGHTVRASQFLQRLAKAQRALFALGILA